MIPKECKRLAEVDFPIAEVSKQAAREKSIRHGHPSTLHLWWARRPLASSRAVLMALLLPDPCDENCPEEFKKQAREVLGEVRRPPKSDEELQKTLLWFIGSFANWDMSSNPTYVRVARDLVRAAHPEETPLVVDPFAGGGSIPLEALRLGCEAFASDLNPVACFILKVMLEDIPRHGPELADELRKVGGEIKAAAEKELADLYPTDPDGATPIAYLWARTVRCESPNCGAEIPLLRSMWLCKKAKRKRALRTEVVRPQGQTPRVEVEIFQPTSDQEVAGGTVTRAKASCLCCGAVLPPHRVRAQLNDEKGGAGAIFDAKGERTGGARMTAVVTLRSGEKGRSYRLPTDADYTAVRGAQARVAEILGEWERGGRQGLCPVPDEPMPTTSGGFMAPPTYGMTRWGDLFTARQKVALCVLGALCRSHTTGRPHLRECLGLVLDGVADRNASITTWRPQADQEKVEHVFTRQALPMAWDFGEAIPLSESTGSFKDRVEIVARAISSMAIFDSPSGQVQSADARDHPLPDQAASIWFTDLNSAPDG